MKGPKSLHDKADFYNPMRQILLNITLTERAKHECKLRHRRLLVFSDYTVIIIYLGSASTMNNLIRCISVPLIILLITACNSTAKTANESTRIPYVRVATDIEYWQNRSESTFATLAHMVNVKTKDGFALYLENESGAKTPIAHSINDAMTKITLPQMSLQVAKKWTLVVDKPEKLVRITPIIDIRLPSQRVRYKDLFVVLKDLDTRRDEVDTMPRWLRQPFYRILFTFEKQSTVTYTNDSGKMYSYHAEKDNTLILKMNEEYYEENGWLFFSEMPNTVLPLN